MSLRPEAPDDSHRPSGAVSRLGIELSPEKRAAIRALHELRPAWNLVIPLWVAIWALAATAVLRWPRWWVYALAYPVIGVAINALGILMHEAIHGNLFRNRRVSRWVGTLLGLPAFQTYSEYGIPHLVHHRTVRTDRDPDELFAWTKDPQKRARAFYVWFFVGMFYYCHKLPEHARRLGTPRQVRELEVEKRIKLAFQIGILAGGWYFGVLHQIVHGWLLPMVACGIGLANMRGWAEHWTTGDRVHPVRLTRTVTSTRLFSFALCNLNYHLEHHLFPGVPWYNLPRVHALLHDEFRAAGALVEPSYARLIWRLFRTGLPATAHA